MDSFDKEKDFAVYYLSNRETLSEIYRQVILSDSVYHEIVEYYRAVDAFCGTEKKKPVSSNSDTLNGLSDTLNGFIQVVDEMPMPIPNVVSRGIHGLNGETNRFFQIGKVKTFLNDTLKPLHRIKKSQSVTQQEYLKLSTRVVSLALNKVIALLNNCNSSPRFQYGLYSDINSTALEVYPVFLKLSSFDMDEDLKKHFDKQKMMIKQIVDRFTSSYKSTSQLSSSNVGSNSGCMLMLCIFIGLVVVTFYECLV